MISLMRAWMVMRSVVTSSARSWRPRFSTREKASISVKMLISAKGAWPSAWGAEMPRGKTSRPATPSAPRSSAA